MAAPSSSLSKLQKEIAECELCPRLRDHCRAIAKARKREFRDWEYWGKPVSGFGDPKARVWIVGLAPAAHGANRTGRMFTGDGSGDWLYRALYETGFASQPDSKSRDDGMKLTDVFISAAARCAPPDNKPTPQELKNCERFLVEEEKRLSEIQVVVPLGKIAWDSLWRTFSAKQDSKKTDFGHDKEARLQDWRVNMSYHPSRQNTNTGRLTWKMWISIFEKVRMSLGD